MSVVSVRQAVCGQQMLRLERSAGFCWIFDKSRITQVWQGRVVEFAPGEQTVDRSTLHSVCGKVSYVRVKALPCLLSAQARSHSPTKFRPLTSAGGLAKWDLIFIYNPNLFNLCWWCGQVRFEPWLVHCSLLRSPGGGSEKDDRIRELEIMVRSLEEKLTRWGIMMMMMRAMMTTMMSRGEVSPSCSTNHFSVGKLQSWGAATVRASRIYLLLTPRLISNMNDFAWSIKL